MAQLVVRNLPEEVKSRLKRRAKRHGRSLEAEVRDLLECAVRTGDDNPKHGLGSELAQAMAAHVVEPEDWEEFEKALAESRKSWTTRPVEFDP